jgi:hypothetical protein
MSSQSHNRQRLEGTAHPRTVRMRDFVATIANTSIKPSNLSPVLIRDSSGQPDRDHEQSPTQTASPTTQHQPAPTQRKNHLASRNPTSPLERLSTRPLNNRPSAQDLRIWRLRKSRRTNTYYRGLRTKVLPS